MEGWDSEIVWHELDEVDIEQTKWLGEPLLSSGHLDDDEVCLWYL